MRVRSPGSLGTIVCTLLLGCSAQVDEPREVGATFAALSSPCDETVPANRNVDGIPAYAQCDEVAEGAIYSNNGVDTSATSMGADWIKTQYSGGYQCTELAHRYLYFVWDVKWIPNGNAGEWCDTTPPASSGMVQTMTPVHGDIMVLAPGSCGASPSTGHVNVIDTVDGNGKVTAVEQNVAGRHQYNQSCGKCFLHVMANDGSGEGGAGATGSGGMSAATGGKGGASGAGGMDGGGTGATGAPAGTGGASGTAGASGSGGMAAGPMRPAPQAGAGGATMAPVMPASGTGGVGAMADPQAGTGAAGTAPPIRGDRSAADTGCSVTRVGAAPGRSHGFYPYSVGPLSLLLVLSRVRRRARPAFASR